MPEGDRPNPPSDVVRCTVSGIVGAGRFANVFWVRNGNDTVPAQGDLTSFLNDLVDAYTNRFKAYMGSFVVVQGGACLYYGPTGAVLDATSSHTLAGTRAGTALPANVAQCIGWKLQAHYRGGHPRTYLPGATSSSIASPTSWDTPIVTGLAAAANSFHADVNAITHGDLSDLHLGTVSFVLRKEWRDPTLFRDFTPSSAKVDSRIDSQRRRLGPDVI